MNKIFVIILSLLTIFSTILPACNSHSAVGIGETGEEGVRVAVLKWTVNAASEHSYIGPALTDMLSSRLGSEAGIQIERAGKVEEAAKSFVSGAVTEESALKAGALLGVDFVLFGSVTLIGESVSLDAKLVNVKTGVVSPLYASGKGISSVITMAGSLSKGAVSEIKKISSTKKSPVDITYTGIFKKDKGQKPDLTTASGVSDAGDFIVVTRKESEANIKASAWRSSNLNGFYHAMSTADLDGDGTEEFFLMSREGITVADFGPNGFTEKRFLKNSSGSINIYISSADIDGDGTPEVYVSALSGRVAGTYLIEYSDGEYKRVPLKSPLFKSRFARAVDFGDGKAALLTQGFRPSRGYLSKVVRITKNPEGYIEIGKVKLPREIIRSGLFGYQFFDLTGAGERELVRIGERGYLEVYRASEKGEWVRFWTNPEPLGGTLNTFDTPENTSDGDTLIFIEVPGDFKRTDLDGDGKSEIIIKKNNAEGFGKFARRKTRFKDGFVSALSWSVAGLDENWRTKNISGYIADFAITDLDGDGSKEITLLVVEGTGRFFRGSKETSYLLTHGGGL